MGIEAVTTFIEETGKRKNKRAYRIQSDLNGQATLEMLQQDNIVMTQQIALETLLEEQYRGFERNPRIRVDNKFDKDLDRLRPFGKVEFFSKVFADKFILELYEEIEKLSLEKTGTYKRHNWVYYGNDVVAKNIGELKVFLKAILEFGFKDNDVIRFINVTPYSRKLETRGYVKGKSGRSERVTKTGKSRNTGSIISKPNGAYHRAMNRLRNRTGNKALKDLVGFTYTQGGTFGLNPPTIQGKYGPMRKKFSEKNMRGGGRPYLYPTIYMVIGSGSTKVTSSKFDFD